MPDLPFWYSHTLSPRRPWDLGLGHPMQCLCFVIVSTPLCTGHKFHSPLPCPTDLRHLVSEKAVSLTVCYVLELIPRDALVLERRGLGNQVLDQWFVTSVVTLTTTTGIILIASTYLYVFCAMLVIFLFWFDIFYRQNRGECRSQGRLWCRSGL